jgi:hypothetical protein
MASGGFDKLVTTDNERSGGWRAIYASASAPGAADYSPHYQSYIWAVYLWGYSKSGFQPLYDRAAAALEAMMSGYPTKWVPTSNGIAMQRARIVLPLAWLVRVNDTATHRQWLQTAVDGLLTRQHCSGDGGGGGGDGWCALKEELSHPGWGGSTRVPNNDDYGTFEAPLNQFNDDPVSDFLYTSNFALLGLHEAAAATGDAKTKAAEDALANYIVRVQTASTSHPHLDGSFARAFDYSKWEPWGSDADIGWGAWSVESGWTQSWITSALGFRQLNTSLWDLGQSIDDIKSDFDQWTPIMFPPPSPPPPPPPCLPPHTGGGGGGAADNTTVSFVLVTHMHELCAPLDGGRAAHVQYNGTTCGGGGGGKTILWETATTLDPRSGEPAASCRWSRASDPADIPGYFGSCGVAATAVPLPTKLC